MHKVERSELFRQRLREVIASSRLSQSAFAATIGIDRSTLSQLLTADIVRLPRAETLALLAEVHQISIDWLLGLTREGNLGTDLIPEPLSFEEYSASAASEQLGRWHAEASGYRVRYVPASLPDLLKTEEVIRHEYQGHGRFRSDQRLESSEWRLAQARRPLNEMEVCQSLQSLRGFARGEGIWASLALGARLRQIEHMLALADELYPRFRWFLFDGLDTFSVPFTVFGPLRAIVFAGRFYLVFNSTEYVRALSDQFDDLIRAAVVQPTDMMTFLEGLYPECR